MVEDKKSTMAYINACPKTAKPEKQKKIAIRDPGDKFLLYGYYVSSEIITKFVTCKLISKFEHFLIRNLNVWGSLIHQFSSGNKNLEESN